MRRRRKRRKTMVRDWKIAQVVQLPYTFVYDVVIMTHTHVFTTRVIE